MKCYFKHLLITLKRKKSAKVRNIAEMKSKNHTISPTFGYLLEIFMFCFLILKIDFFISYCDPKDKKISSLSFQIISKRTIKYL